MNISLSRRTDLAIKALGALDRARERVSGERLAGEIDTTTQFLPQIVGPLIRAGWIGSERGPRGGYFSLVSIGKISMLEVVEAAEGEIENGRCILRDGPCPGTVSCPIHSAWLSAREVLVTQLRQLTVAQALVMEVGA